MDGTSKFIDHNDIEITLPIWGFAEDAETAKLFIPSPTIYAKEGDSVHIRMKNPSMEGHTIHLHGLDVDEANDGVPHYTGFVQSGEEVVYRFKATHAGNFLYHCHVTTTMHLSLGMYGSVIVYPSDSSKRPYDGGPTYDRQYHYLLSDMDARWNEDYTSIGSFLSYDPDLFLINGKNKRLIYNDSSMILTGDLDDTLLLRLLNVGYRVNRVVFPDELEATVVTSDGRVLDEAFQTDTLFLYPGERYSVICQVMDTNKSSVKVDYLDPFRLAFLGREYIPLNDTSFVFLPYQEQLNAPDSIGVGHAELVYDLGFEVYPNPARETVVIHSPYDKSRIQVFDLNGNLILDQTVGQGRTHIDVSDFPVGLLLFRLESVTRGSASFRIMHM